MSGFDIAVSEAKAVAESKAIHEAIMARMAKQNNRQPINMAAAINKKKGG